MAQYKGPERRMDTENRLPLALHQGRALDRFRGTNAENVTTASFREGEPMRKEMRRLLDRLEGKLTPEQLRLQELVEKQYAGELAVLKEFGLYDSKQPNEGDVPAPSMEDASQTLLTNLAPEQVAEILKHAKQPQFQLEAVTSFERYVAALDSHKKMPRQVDAYVSSERRAAWAEQDAKAGIGNNIVGWNVGIIDAVQELEADPELHGNLGEKRTQAEAKLSSSGLRLPHPRRYALAQMRALKQGKPLDAATWSALNDDSGDRSVVPGGYWFASQVNFDEDLPDNQNDGVRFRPEVVAQFRL